MFRMIFKLILGVAAGTALAYYFTSDRGRTVARRAGDRLRTSGQDASRMLGFAGPPGVDADRDAIEAKIEETRQRLREQIDAIAMKSTE